MNKNNEAIKLLYTIAVFIIASGALNLIIYLIANSIYGWWYISRRKMFKSAVRLCIGIIVYLKTGSLDSSD